VSPAAGQPVTAAIYQLDSLVRRAPSLQLTADAKLQGGL
jgi:NADH-quinone oxidoreductase subunit G